MRSPTYGPHWSGSTAPPKQANRTADAYEIWREDYLTQVAVAWVLGCVFVRFLEDNRLIDEPRLSGAGDRLRRAKDHHTLYFLTPVIAWAGWDHLQQAQALAGYYVQMKERAGWSPQRITALLAGLLELIPWLKQWHNAIDPTYGVGLGDYFTDFVQEEARTLGLTAVEIRAWRPS